MAIYYYYFEVIHCKKLKVALTCVLGPLNSFLMSERQQIRSGMTFNFEYNLASNNLLHDLLNFLYNCMPTNT